MSFYRLYAEQYLPISAATAWDFISEPANLAKITPPGMKFEIRGEPDSPVYQGQIIHYRLNPSSWIRLSWVTEISHLQQGRYFVDEQRFGPYRFWHHKHKISPYEDGIVMEDLVDYRLPFGILGDLAHSVYVESKLQKIFSYRAAQLSDRFGHYNGKPERLNIQKI